MSFLITIAIGTLLLQLPVATVTGQGLRLVDALFTATSATCVTGLVVVSTATDLSIFGQILVMLMIQIGGLGLMTVATLFAIILGKKISFQNRLIMQEALNQITPAGIIRLTKHILIFTLVVELSGAFLLSLRWFSLYGFNAFYLGLFHSISAFNNAGFDIFGNSLENFYNDWYINLIIMALFISGGLGFTVIAEVYVKGMGNFRSYSLHSKMVLLLTGILLMAGFMVVFIFEYTNPATLGPMSLSDKVITAFFQGATPRTAGFNTISIGEMRTSTLVFLILLMFIGASPASTGGGIKTTTFGTVAMAVWSTIKGREHTVIFERRIPNVTVFKALSVAFIAMLLIMGVLMFLSITENISFLPIFFEVVSAFGTVGLSTGITAKLTTIGKIIITLTMFVGRVGPLTLAFALTSQQKGIRVGYPEEKVIIG